MQSRKYWAVGLRNEWVRQINNSWAEKFEVQIIAGGPALLAIASSGTVVTSLITAGDVWCTLESCGFGVTCENKYGVANAVCRGVLEKLIDRIGRENERIEFDRLLLLAADQFMSKL